MAGTATSTDGEMTYLDIQGLSRYDSNIKQSLSKKETAGAADSALATAKEYTDSELQKFSTETNAALTVLGEEIDTKASSDHTHNYAGSDTPGGSANTAVSDISNREFQRFYDTLIPLGAEKIPNNSDLNNPTFLKVGKFYSHGTTISTLTNCPTAMNFVMTVKDVTARGTEYIDIDESSVAKYGILRLREIEDYAGNVWNQYCISQSTAGVWTMFSWKQVIRSNYSPTIKIRSGGIADSSGTLGDGINLSLSKVYDGIIDWGGSDWKGNFSPLDAALIPELGANRLCFMPAECIDIEYSRDAGETWETYNITDNTKVRIVSNIKGYCVTIGGNQNEKGVDKTDHQVRVTIDSYDSNNKQTLYTHIRKMSILCSTDGSSGSYVKIYGLSGNNYNAGNDTWTLLKKASLSGWSGYNIINGLDFIFGGTNAFPSYYRKIRLVFGCTGMSEIDYCGLSIYNICAFGGVGWVCPSTMAKTGVPYTYDVERNVSFSSGITASTVTASLNGNAKTATLATSATNDGNGNEISRFYDSATIKGATQISTTVDLNTLPYLKLGRYYTTSSVDVSSLSNCPTSEYFYMFVRTPMNSTIDNEETIYWYGGHRIREIVTVTGKRYTQHCGSTSTAGVWTYDEWVREIDSRDLATTSTDGLLSSSDKAKLDAIATGATKVIVDADLNASSTNAIQNKAVTTEFDNVKDIITNTKSELQTNINGVQTNLTTHTNNKSNPHEVTKTQVGLGNVPNVATNDQTPTYTAATSLTTLVSGEKLSVSMGKIMKAITDLIAHIANKSNPHGVTYSQVGADAAGSAAKVQTNLDTVEDKVDDHIANSTVHFTSTERTKLSGIATGANNYTHPNSGVTAGTYKSVTVNAQGHVTAGTNPTTLAGYGITDAEAKGSVNTHNSSTTAHNDIRTLITNLTTKVNNFLDVDDTTTDQLSEVIALINENKTDIASITSDKVNVSDIVNNLTTNVTNKPLSAAQGVAIKTLIDSLSSSKVDKVDGKGLSTNDYTTAEKTKLSGIATGAEVNQNAFSNIVIGTTTVAADSKTDSVTFTGSNVTIAGDATNDKVTFSVADGSTTTKGVVKLEDGVSSTSTTTAATPNSVKSAYDLANTAKTNADSAQTKANSAYDLAGTKANATHSHTVSEVTGLQSSLDSKSNTGHTHAISEVTNLQTTLDDKAASNHTHDNYIGLEKMGVANGVATLGDDGKVPSAQLPSSNSGGLSYRIDNAVFAASNWTMDSTIGKYKYVYNNANISETTVVNVMFTLTSLSYANNAGVQQEVIESDGYITLYSNALPTADLVADILIYGAITSESLTADANAALSNQVTDFGTRLTTLENNLNTTKHYWSLAEVNNTLTTSSTMEEIFNAMATKSVLVCVMASASTSVYPSATGILEIHKVDGNYGTATFHYDGKTASGTFTA